MSWLQDVLLYVRQCSLSIHSQQRVAFRQGSRVIARGGTFLEALEARVLLTAGGLDLTFDGDGKVSTEFEASASWGNEAHAIAAQADGKTVAVGRGSVVRYFANGALDATFGQKGLVAFPHDAAAVAIQADGRILVAGTAGNSPKTDFVVARYLSNGTLDTTFDGDGFAFADFESYDMASGIVIQPNGRILVVGISAVLHNGPTPFTDTYKIAVARWLINGALDTSFDGDGKARYSMTGARDIYGRAIAVQSDNRIVVVGSALVPHPNIPSNIDFIAMRLNPSGSLDPTFDGDGFQTIGFSDGPGGSSETANSLAIQSDGRIVLSGLARISFQESVALARLNANGSLDTSFSGDGRQLRFTSGGLSGRDSFVGGSTIVLSNGKILVPNGRYFQRFNANGTFDTTFGGPDPVFGTRDGAYFGWALSAARRGDGKYVVGGTRHGLFSVGRFNLDGNPDLSFSVNGFAETETGSSRDTAARSVLQPDGKIIVVGQSRRTISAARYLTNGRLDATFGVAGRLMIPLPDQYLNSTATDVALQADGKIVITGIARELISFDHNRIVLVRLNANGSLDTSFSGGGLVITNLAYNSSAKTVAIQPDGKIVVGGAGVSGNFGLLRYLPNGTLDNTFSGDGKVEAPTGDNFSQVNDLVIQPDGKILAVGTVERQRTSVQYRSILMVVRFNANGSLDSTFGTNGRFIGAPDEFALRTGEVIKLLADGKFLVAGNENIFEVGGTSNSPQWQNMAVTRFNANGTIDAAFGTRIETTQYSPPGQPFTRNDARTSATSMVVEANGKILLGGRDYESFNIVRLNGDGTRDTSFGGDGSVQTSFNLEFSSISDLLLQTDGKLIAVGTDQHASYRSYYDSDFVLARYLTPLETPFSTEVRVSPLGRVTIKDLWDRDDQLEVRVNGDTITVIDLSPDSRAKFQVFNHPDRPQITGHGTKQISFSRLITASSTGQALVDLEALDGDDSVLETGDLGQSVDPLLLRFYGSTGLDKLHRNITAASRSRWDQPYSAPGSVKSFLSGATASQDKRLTRFYDVEHLVGGDMPDELRITGSIEGGPHSRKRFNGSGGADSLIMNEHIGKVVLGNSEISYPDLGWSMELAGLGNESAVVKTVGNEDSVIDARGFSGSLELRGGGGDDMLLGSNSDFQSVIYGGAGDDIIVGSNGDDQLYGGPGNDVLNGGYGVDVLRGDDGNDILVGGEGADRLFGGNGDDIIIGSHGFRLLPVGQSYSLATLNPVRDVWTSTEAYSERVVRLRDTGVGPGNVLRLRPGIRVNDLVRDDSEIDTLFGESGRDWFFASLVESTHASLGVRDLSLDEVLTLLV